MTSIILLLFPLQSKVRGVKSSGSSLLVLISLFHSIIILLLFLSLLFMVLLLSLLSFLLSHSLFFAFFLFLTCSSKRQQQKIDHLLSSIYCHLLSVTIFTLFLFFSSICWGRFFVFFSHFFSCQIDKTSD